MVSSHIAPFIQGISTVHSALPVSVFNKHADRDNIYVTHYSYEHILMNRNGAWTYHKQIQQTYFCRARVTRSNKSDKTAGYSKGKTSRPPVHGIKLLSFLDEQFRIILSLEI